MPGARILLVDDDAAYRLAVGKTLRAAGHQVDEAADGAQAMRALSTLAVQVLVTDIVMPERDGFELIASARRQHPELKILAVSGSSMFNGLNLLKVASTIGADAALAKPFSPEELIAAIEAVVQA